VQHLGVTPGLGRLDHERLDQRQAEKAFIEGPRLFRAAAAIGCVVKLLDHVLRCSFTA
jgi:hypothetical protein